MSAIGYDNGLFNMEFMYDPHTDSVATIEINPRMSSQFADLFEKVDGTNTYDILLDLAGGRTPHPKRRKGAYARAASCVLRIFENKTPRHLPSEKDIERAQAIAPEIRIEILAAEGRKLSQELQDGCSYRYGIINLGGRDDEDIREGIRECLACLPFVFEATAKRDSGASCKSETEGIRVATAEAMRTL